MKKTIYDIAREQYADGKSIYDISVSLGLEPKNVKEALTEDDEYHHSLHAGQTLKDEFDEIRYAFYLLETGKGKLITLGNKKYTKPIRR